MFENKSTIWVIHISNDDETARRAQEDGFICIGWTVIGNLTPYDTRDKMKAAYSRAFPNALKASIRASYGQCFRFAHEMQLGDPVIYPIKGDPDILIGAIEGPYRWASDDKQLVQADYCNVRKVKWLKKVPRIAFSQEALSCFASATSVSTADDFLDEVIAVLKGENIEPIQPAKETININAATQAMPGEHRANLADQAVQETEDYLLRQWSRTAQDFETVVAAVICAMNHSPRAIRDA